MPHVEGALEDPVIGGWELCRENLQELFVGLEHCLVILCDHTEIRDRASWRSEGRKEGKRGISGTC